MQNYTSFYNMPGEEREALAYRSLTLQLAELKADLSRVGSHQTIALLIQKLEHDIAALHGQHSLSTNWPTLDDRVCALDSVIRNTKLTTHNIH